MMKIYIVWSTEYKHSGPICYFLNEENAKNWKDKYDLNTILSDPFYSQYPEKYESDLDIRTVETKDNA